MKKEKIDELRNRREKLQEEIRRNSIAQRVSAELSHIESQDQPYKLYYNYENLNWIASNTKVRNRDGYNGMHGDFQIDVDDSKAKEVFHITQAEINTPTFTQHLLTLAPKLDSLIICRDGGDPEIETSLEAFVSNPSVFFDSFLETWILAVSKKWVLEYIFDQGVIRIVYLDESSPTLEKLIILA